jgi:hypothetical protein
VPTHWQFDVTIISVLQPQVDGTRVTTLYYLLETRDIPYYVFDVER